MVASEIIVLLVLLTIFLEDTSIREVHMVLFPLLAGALLIAGLKHGAGFQALWESASVNLLFLMLVLLLLTAWFSLKEKRVVNVTLQLLGWGDIWFLVCIALYFSILNYLFFYIASLLAVVVLWSAWRFISKKNNQHIPLAGMQALMLAIYLSCDWWLIHFNAVSDNWLLRFIYQWT
ncbi:hypothetical protein SAMN05216490_4787 [Mucilaginibacter mallensis]|uniref:Type IV leader peptidase family protein n=1 Tax=Mucilaginibacter mallensis TaxID=652787 RepID=A0A1H2CAM4_MUCMA|nr:hypothetical protein [Mucilaginibacter mallensis]SDT67379.1 hypothetical protein SAMN05216490_4787 [Mucilaginibacter mallensis]